MIFSKLSQTFLLLFSCVLLLGSLSQAAEETKYVASMSGVECTACKKTIAQAISKLGGVKTIRIIKKSKKSHQLEIYTDGSNELTKEDAVKALAKAKHYSPHVTPVVLPVAHIIAHRRSGHDHNVQNT